MAQSGSMFEAARLAKRCGASRTTVSNYLAVLETAFAMHVIRPYAGGGRSEIVSAPKVYGFDTGFVCHYRGATTLRPADLDPLWEHLVLNELHAHVGRNAIRYWRTKHGSEVDFVLVRPGRAPVAVECCWSAGDFEPAAMRSFRGAYPGRGALVRRHRRHARWRRLRARLRPAARDVRLSARPGADVPGGLTRSRPPSPPAGLPPALTPAHSPRALSPALPPRPARAFPSRIWVD